MTFKRQMASIRSEALLVMDRISMPFYPFMNILKIEVRRCVKSFTWCCRFCSQPFKIDDFHESIHLCNNAIQARYKNGERSSSLPEENMWDNETFINYLRQVCHSALSYFWIFFSSFGLIGSWNNIHLLLFMSSILIVKCPSQKFGVQSRLH